jgi:RHS repeat-associated protein
VSAFALLVFAGLDVTFGQDVQNTDNKADQVLRSTGRVNPSSLGMEMSIPLGNYPGRGMSVPISLSYSSKLWRIEYTSSTPKVNNPTCWQIHQAKYGENSNSGWTTSIGIPYVEYSGRDNLYDETGAPWESDADLCNPEAPPEYHTLNYIKRINIHLPSGETHELRADDTAHDDGPSTQANWNTTYYAVDSSNLRYEEDSTTGRYRLLMPDGSFYDFVSSISGLGDATVRMGTTYTDRNGNYVTYHAPTSGHLNGYVTDTLGRTLDSPVNPTVSPTPGDQTYTIPGLGSGTLTYTLHWKQLKGGSSGASGLTNYSDTLKYTGSVYGYTYRSSGTFLFANNSDNLVLSESSVFNPVVLTGIDLPTGGSYTFTYDIYGRIERIYYPTGGEERFTYSEVAPLSMSMFHNVTDQANFGVTNRKVYETAGTGTPYEWNYAVSTTDAYGYKVTMTNPDGTETQRFLHRGIAACTGCSTAFGYDNALAGMAYEERAFDANGDIVSRSLKHWTVSIFTAPGGADPMWHPRVDHEESYTYDTSGDAVYSTSKYEYEGNLSYRDTPVLVNKTIQWGYQTATGGGSISPSATPVSSPTPVPTPSPSPSPVRTTESTYLINDTNYSGVASYYTAQNMTGLVTVSKVKDSAGTVVAQSEIIYDESGRSPGYRGNPTTAKVWDSTKGVVSSSGNFISKRAKFDSYGNQYESTDALGNTTTTTFDGTYYTFPITVTSPVPDSGGTYGSSTAFTTSATFDFDTGLPLTTTDVNGQVTTMEYDDPLFRLTKVTAPNGAETITEYGAGTSPSTRWVKVSSQFDATSWKEGYSWYDGLGRAIRTKKEDSTGDVYALVCYDSVGRMSKTSNPFRGYSTQDCSTSNGTSDIYWTTNTFDAASRPWKVTTPDSAFVETTYGVATSGSAIGTVVTVADQAGKLRRTVSNALGQLTRVDEPNGSNVLGSMSSPNQPTSYDYDTLNNLTTVTQGSQTRTFTYNSLSRLKEAANPESGTIKYTYDDNGNLKTKWDARGIKTIHDYDALNRVWKRCYKSVGTGSLGYTTCATASGETAESNTPDVTYYYDNLTDGKGRIKKVVNSHSTTEYTGYDILGRVTSHKQTTGGNDFVTAYTYNLAGDLLTETYPDGRIVKNTLDVNGGLSLVETKPFDEKDESEFETRASNFVYSAAGAATSLKLGNNKYENTVFNSRLQPTQIGLGTTSSNANILQLDYTYGSTDNNGNIQTQTITVPGVTYPLIQNYTYDSLNRLASATETSNSVQTWTQVYGFDRYGNRNITSGTGATSLTFSSTTNKITTSGYTFDANGNTTADPSGKAFVYDGENKQKSVTNGGTLGTYYYDGDGKRVKKTSSADNIIFVYDGAGKLIEERNSSNGALITTYVYAGSRLLSMETVGPTTNYLTADHLGTPRINTDGSGNVVARHDYMPFGEEIFTALTAQRTSGVGYPGGDGVRKQFTGYERDGETGLDFAEARMYSITLGRFITSDPLMASAIIVTPQTWNRYSYVLNNPLNIVDPSGELPESFTKDQIRLFQTYVDTFNKDNKTSFSADEVWNKLSQSQQTTFIGTTHALENSMVTPTTGGAGVTAISLVKTVTRITGEYTGKDKKLKEEGKIQFRLLVTLAETAINQMENSNEFSEKDITSGHIYDGGDEAKLVDGNIRQNEVGDNPTKLQISYDPNNLLQADIDVDYLRNLEGHNKPYNSDIRSSEGRTRGIFNRKTIVNLDRHNQRYGQTNPLRNLPVAK